METPTQPPTAERVVEIPTAAAVPLALPTPMAIPPGADNAAIMNILQQNQHALIHALSVQIAGVQDSISTELWTQSEKFERFVLEAGFNWKDGLIVAGVTAVTTATLTALLSLWFGGSDEMSA